MQEWVAINISHAALLLRLGMQPSSATGTLFLVNALLILDDRWSTFIGYAHSD
jgi:hypothetical protein